LSGPSLQPTSASAYTLPLRTISIVGNTFVPPGMTAADVAILQRIAHETVTEGQKPKK
jgi:hypothetical protein